MRLLDYTYALSSSPITIPKRLASFHHDDIRDHQQLEYYHCLRSIVHAARYQVVASDDSESRVSAVEFCILSRISTELEMTEMLKALDLLPHRGTVS